MRRIVIIGASVAGLGAADALREAGFDGAIQIVGAEIHAPYDRPPLSKQALAAPAKGDAFYPLRPEKHYATNGFDLILGRKAVRLDAAKKLVRLDGGESLSYDGLVIATGCRARRLRTSDGEPLPVLRTLDDARWLAAAARRHRHAVLIGAGFIGLEVAASLRTLGLDVTVLESAPIPLKNSLGPELADWLRAYHASCGVRIEAGVQVRSIESTNGTYEVVLDDGRRLEAGLVLAGIGVEPNTEWLDGSGVSCDAGVLCDHSGRTNVPGIVAAGDVVNLADPGSGRVHRIEHWTHAMKQGRAAARSLVLQETSDLGVPYFWTDQFERKLQGYGRRQAGDSVRIVEGSLESGEYLALFGAGESFHGILSSGRAKSIRNYRKLLEQGGTWSQALAMASSSTTTSTTSLAAA
jgi:3-phenylpropionate/trans-cinnamate dioxygenase ferredoxin reductase subunit